jgi:hypothetical protein
MGDEPPHEPVHPPTSSVPAATTTGYPQCIGCGYDLSGVSADGRCPECAVPVVRTLQGDRLRFSPPEYLATLKQGATVTAVGVLTWLILKAAAFAAALVTGRWLDDPPPQPHPVLSWLTGGALLVALYGWWRLGAPDPSLASRERTLSGRRALRCLVLCAGAATVADRVLPLGAPAALSTPAIWLLHLIAAMLYIQHLAGRIPNAPLRELAMAPLGVTLLMFIPCLPIMLITMTFGPWTINLLVLVTVLGFRTAIGRLLRSL